MSTSKMKISFLHFYHFWWSPIGRSNNFQCSKQFSFLFKTSLFRILGLFVIICHVQVLNCQAAKSYEFMAWLSASSRWACLLIGTLQGESYEKRAKSSSNAMTRGLDKGKDISISITCTILSTSEKTFFFLICKLYAIWGRECLKGSDNCQMFSH